MSRGTTRSCWRDEQTSINPPLIFFTFAISSTRSIPMMLIILHHILKKGGSLYHSAYFTVPGTRKSALLAGFDVGGSYPSSRGESSFWIQLATVRICMLVLDAITVDLTIICRWWSGRGREDQGNNRPESIEILLRDTRPR